MDKKVLTLLIFIIIVVILGGIALTVNIKKAKDTGKNTENTNINSNQGNNTEIAKTGKVLVLYFSQSGNTEAVANIIHNEVGGDIVKLAVSGSSAKNSQSTVKNWLSKINIASNEVKYETLQKCKVSFLINMI